ncbi:MAG: hypothetical protein IPL59_08020 [Candidatus Competibacteraceae bacterium]|nr:hypothetical protein [Candidatus Contendobacter odensis]MBK8535075.1 hypothetical protein [Candidatus Competibacteraceae bacterium]MBK8753278.1 hypothetical protein [Candidatus Competibacteraceae bacterium]
MLRNQGYEVMVRPSRWQLGSEQAMLQTTLLESWVSAALEIAPEAADELANWQSQRRRWIEYGQSRLQVGHRDL